MSGFELSPNQRQSLEIVHKELAVLPDVWNEVAEDLRINERVAGFSRGMASGYTNAAKQLHGVLERLGRVLPDCRHGKSIIARCQECIVDDYPAAESGND